MTPRPRGLLFDPATTLTLAVTALWVHHELTPHHRHPQQRFPLRICGAELGTEAAADQPWVYIRPPHPGTGDHRAPDGSTWRD